MSTNDLTVTLVGWVATEPKHYTGAALTPFTSFRMASTRRYFDRARNTWTDGRTEWFTVKAWRQSALNVAASLRKGDPVLVHGRLSTEQWDGPEGPRTSLVLEALAVGPDLTYGRATFARTVHVGGADAAGSGAPGDAGPDEAADGGWAAGALDGHAADDPWATDGGADTRGADPERADPARADADRADADRADAEPADTGRADAGRADAGGAHDPESAQVSLVGDRVASG